MNERRWMLVLFGFLGVCVGYALSKQIDEWNPPLKGDFAIVDAEEDN